MLNIQTQQVLLPKKVYLGDSAELRVTFTLNAEFSENIEQQEEEVVVEQENQESANQEEIEQASENIQFLSRYGYFSEALNGKDYVISDVQMNQTGPSFYQLSIYFIPWKTGVIQLPPYILTDVEGEEYQITLEPVNIVSLLELNDQGSYSTELQKPQGPLLLPGTSYKLWIGLIIFVILLIIGIRLLVKHKEVNFYIKNQILLRRYKRNARGATKKLSKLIEMEKNPEKLRAAGKHIYSDQECAAEIQMILRTYLEVRYEYPFINTVSSQIMHGFNTVTAGLADEAKIDAAGEIAAAFTRTDYIRYSPEGFFLLNEKITLLSRLKENIKTLESTAQDQKIIDKKKDKRTRRGM